MFPHQNRINAAHRHDRLCVAFVVTTTRAAAQSGVLATDSAGFDTVGFIQAATIDHPISTAGDLQMAR